MFGYAAGELQGRAIEVLVPPAVRDKHPGLREGFLREGGTRAMGALNTELRGVRKDGSQFPGRRSGCRACRRSAGVASAFVLRCATLPSARQAEEKAPSEQFPQ
jgi:hypothetical protein